MDIALYYNKLALKGFLKIDNNYKYVVSNDIVAQEIALHQPTEAKAFLLNFIHENPPSNAERQELMAASLGKVYDALKQYNLPEINFRRMIRLDSIV